MALSRGIIKESIMLCGPKESGDVVWMSDSLVDSLVDWWLLL